MKIALIQQKASQDINSNIEKGIASVKEAAFSGVNIVCFAELAFTPFYPQKPAGENILDLGYRPIDGRELPVASHVRKTLPSAAAVASPCAFAIEHETGEAFARGIEIE